MPQRGDEATLRARLLEVIEAFPSGDGRGGAGGSAGGGGRRARRARAGGHGGGGGGNGDGGGNRGARGGGGGAGGQTFREGDWCCPRAGCRFSPNFASRTSCLRCGERRPSGGGGHQRGEGRPTPTPSAGPMGANGARPMLAVWGRRQQAEEAAPTHRRPGSSLAAVQQAARLQPRPGRAGAHAGIEAKVTGAAAGGGSGGGPTGGTVGPQGRAAASAAANGTEGQATDCGIAAGGRPPAAGGQRQRPRWADDDVPADAGGGGDDDGNSDYADEDAAWDAWDEDANDDDDAGEPTPADLRARWQSECRVVRALEAQGVPSDSTALAAARAARDEAEAAWRSRKAPQPLSTRMGWAQRKLDRAEQSLARARDDLAYYEEEVEARRAELQEKIDQADQRYRLRWQQMQELHDEAGGTSAARASEGLCTMVARELQAFAEMLEEGSEVRGRANLLLSKLADVASGASPQTFDMARGDVDSDCEMGHQEEADVLGTRTHRSADARPDGQPGAGSSWRTDPNGRWNRSARDACNGKQQGHGGETQVQTAAGRAGGTPHGAGTGMDTKGNDIAAAAAPPAPATPPAAAAPMAKGLHGTTGRARGAARVREEEEQGPPNKSHRGSDDEQVHAVESIADDAARAAKLQEEQNAAIEMAKAANATFGDSTSVHIAAQVYAHKVELARARAVAVGVATVVAGRPLLELSPEEFNAWVKDTLTPAETAQSDKP